MKQQEFTIGKKTPKQESRNNLPANQDSQNKGIRRNNTNHPHTTTKTAQAKNPEIAHPQKNTEALDPTLPQKHASKHENPVEGPPILNPQIVDPPPSPSINAP